MGWEVEPKIRASGFYHGQTSDAPAIKRGETTGASQAPELTPGIACYSSIAQHRDWHPTGSYAGQWPRGDPAPTPGTIRSVRTELHNCDIIEWQEMGVTVTKIYFVAGLLPLLRHNRRGSISTTTGLPIPSPSRGGAKEPLGFHLLVGEAMP